MKIKTLLPTVLFALTTWTVAHGQTDKLNQFDTNGKKDGKWTVYLDNQWKEVKDSEQAVYYRYTWYAHGTNTSPMGSFGKLTLVPADNDLQKGKPKLLDGEYKWQDKNGQTKFILVLKKGEFISYKEFYKSGQVHQYFDYTKKWQGQPHTYCMTIYDKTGNPKDYYMRSGESGWMGYGYKDADSTTIKTLKTVGDSSFVTMYIYKNGKLTGQRDQIQIQQSDGKTKYIQHGHIIEWYLNGQKREEGDYYYGKKTGQWKWWDENGNEKRQKHKRPFRTADSIARSTVSSCDCLG